MSPSRQPQYYAARRLALIRASLCVYGAAHGPALPMRTYCAKCQRRIRRINARRNPLRKKES